MLITLPFGCLWKEHNVTIPRMTQDEMIYFISRLAVCFKVYLSLSNTIETKKNQVTHLKPKDNITRGTPSHLSMGNAPS